MPRKAPYGVNRGTLSFNVLLLSGTGAVEFVTDWVAGFTYTIESVKAYVQTAGAGTSASRTLRVLKGASTVVATATVLLAEVDTIGKERALTVTAANATYSDTDVLTVDIASGGTQFTAGELNLVIVYRQQPQRVA
jgi:hypothetical protein